jgi:hypothetical protein
VVAKGVARVVMTHMLTVLAAMCCCVMPGVEFSIFYDYDDLGDRPLNGAM